MLCVKMDILPIEATKKPRQKGKKFNGSLNVRDDRIVEEGKSFQKMCDMLRKNSNRAEKIATEKGATTYVNT
ncbi:hypothetical protein Y032_0896g2927 [Ancylostoma ceylanicum]|uniref:Uncharacterized protein n=1 Tax=Ancylostoma ceylanicum TaxID=53326 RepID=A0A016WA12_9BILA|nr:hypothetical protein Y032_0896g2927 [Ancylostoma ceylanicum]